MQRIRIVRFKKIFQIQFNDMDVQFKMFHFPFRHCISQKNWTTVAKNCSCLPSCNSVGYTNIGHLDDRFYERYNRILHIKTLISPTRIKRDILLSFDFLVVSFGGAAGLFLGCSFISIVEIIYFIAKHLHQRYFNRINN